MSTSVDLQGSDSDDSLIESDSYQKRKRETLMFESVQKTFNRILKGDTEEIETKLEKIKKDDLDIRFNDYSGNEKN